MVSYTGLTDRAIREGGIATNDAKFNAEWPSIVVDAETRILRELDPLVGRAFAQSVFGPTAPANALLPIPDGVNGDAPACLVMREMAFFTPVGTTDVRHAIDRRAESFIKDYWPNRSLTDLPRYFCEIGHDRLLVAPSPPDRFIVELAYTARPVSLVDEEPGDGTQTTYLSRTYPDLLFFAAMVGVAGHKKNYGAMADDPRQAISWEGRYQGALASARIEEGRRKSGNYADESQSRPPEAAPIT